MTVEVGGAGTLGLGWETTLGTYAAPTKWVRINSESLEKVEDKVYRMALRGTADRTGAIQGYTHVQGDIVFEVSPDVLVWFLYASRCLIAKVTGPPIVYTFTPAHIAKASTGTGATTRRTLSALVARSGNPMAYTGLSVGQLAFSLNNGVLVCTASMIGVDESAQSAGTPTFPAQTVVGPGMLSIEVPTATARADADTFGLTINDNLSPANRLNGQKKAAYQNWGEREVTVSMETDFDPLTDFNAFVAQTVQAITIKGIVTASVEQVIVTINAAIQDANPVFLGGLGDVNRQSLSYHGIYNTTDVYSIAVTTAESIT